MAVTEVANDAALRNLVEKIDHIVVLMLENRSFDHMLGFLTIEQGRSHVEGPTEALANEAGGQTYPVHAARGTKLAGGQDPCHSGRCVDEQIAHGAMSGFAANYWATRPQPPVRGDSPGVVMAYHTAEQLPVYAQLAARFCVCDHWFSSVPGQTMPNRCYAVAGTSRGERDNRRPTQLYNLPSFCRQLDSAEVSWRWYSFDYVPTLWVIDSFYGLSHATIPAYFDRRDLFSHRSFLDRAAAGDLPAVSWIDPNFVDLSFGPAGSNDDHPPSDLRAAQRLVLQLFDAVAQSPAWQKTLVVITYDEHGGFYDHVAPPAAADDHANLRRYGPRVPAFVVSPWVAPGLVDHTVYDHTSIIKTILARFCRKPDGTVPDMGARVRAAHHLGGVLGEDEPRPAPARSEYRELIAAARAWREAEAEHPLVATDEGIVAPQTQLTDFQEEFLAYRNAVLTARRARRETPHQRCLES
jgi:phospholipase C